MNEETIEFLKEQIANFEQQWADYKLEGVRNNPVECISYNINLALEVFSDSLSAQLPEKDALKHLRLLKDLGVANFVSSMNDGKTISLPFGDARLEIVGEATTAYMNTDTWLKAYYAAIVIRDRNAIDILCKVPEEIFLGANIKPDEFDLAFVRASKGLFDPAVNIGQLLVDAMEASAEEKISEPRLGYAWSLILPVLMLYRFAVDGDKDGEFNEKFEYALEQHRGYWQTEEKKHKSVGWKSLPLMAAAVLVFDNKGLKMPNDNELVPRWVVEHFPGVGATN